MNTTPVRAVQRSDPAPASRPNGSPSASAGPGANRRPADSERESSLNPAAPAASQDAFEQALQRVAEGRVPAAKPRGSHAGFGDADELDAGAAGSEGSAIASAAQPSMPLAQAMPTPSPQQAAAPAPTWSARAPQPLDAVSKQLNALQLPPANGLRSEWQLQLLDRSLPVQQLDIQRGAAGALRVVLSASPETARSAPLDRLRQRLVARGSAPESLVFRQAREELDS